MGVNQTYTCDCCGEEMPDSSVLSCVIVTRLEEDTSEVRQHYFCRLYGCAKALNKQVDGLPSKHANHAESPPPPPEPAAPIEPVVDVPALTEESPAP